MRFIRSNSIFDALYQTAVSYPAPASLNYYWNFGVYALVCLGIQILTGIFLAFHYVADVGLAFVTIEYFMRDVDYGWLLRFVHANGASMFFIAVYIHTFRGIYYSSFMYPRMPLWTVGVAILFLMILTAFTGYVLPWGQMSYWAATVITNMLTVVPDPWGRELVEWLWGGFAINNTTLNRFFAFHYLLPFLLLSLVGVHLLLLHQHGSSNPLGIYGGSDLTVFFPYYIVKDLYGTIIFFMFFSLFVFFAPNYLGHPVNFLPANPFVTPPHIVPEWYFLPFYAILRAIPTKNAGILAMGGSVAILFLVPFIMRPEVRSMRFRPMSRYVFWVFIVTVLTLGWAGAVPIKSPYLEVGRLVSIVYFSYYILVSPFIIVLERVLWGNEDFFCYHYDLYTTKFRKIPETVYRFHLRPYLGWGSSGVDDYSRDSFEVGDEEADEADESIA